MSFTGSSLLNCQRSKVRGASWRRQQVNGRGALTVNERNSIEMTFNNMNISIYRHHNKVIERIKWKAREIYRMTLQK